MDKNKNNINKIVSRLTESEWEQFKLGNLFVRCRTKEDAKEFVRNCSLHNIKFLDNDDDHWEIFKDKTIYSVLEGSLCCSNVILEYFADTHIIEFNYNPTPICICDNKKDNDKAGKEEYMAMNNSTNMDFNRLCEHGIGCVQTL